MQAHSALHASVDEKPTATASLEEPGSPAAKLRVSLPFFYRCLVLKEELVVTLAPPDTIRLSRSVAHPFVTLRGCQAMRWLQLHANQPLFLGRQG